MKRLAFALSGVLGTRRLRCVRKVLLSAAACLAPVLAHAIDPNALPTGGAVASGAASISQAGSRLTVQQQSGRAIVNWNTFNIGSQAAVNFQQPSTSSVVLNRVSAGGGVSEIYGSLTANGQVFLVNPSGTLFGHGAQVNVGGLVSSSLDIANADFLSGNYRFASYGFAGSIVNQGALTAADGGYIALLAPQVRNEGVIAAHLGTVAIGAGNAVALDLSGTGLISMKVEQGAVDALIANNSLVQADGGTVFMSARAAGQLVGGVINNSGEIRAARITEHDGVIRLEAGDVTNTGAISVDGSSGGNVSLVALDTLITSGSVSARGTAGQGGEIRLLGDKVGLFGSSKVDVSGEAGGGTILVGGNYQGKGPEPNASRTVIDPDATINASATGKGDGGKVVVWANDLTRFSGSIEARGGPQGGNGGFVETSAKNVLQAYGSVDAGAPNGKGGLWLLDPNNITISASTGANTTGSFDSTDDNAIVNNVTLGAALTNGTTVSVTTQSLGTNSQAGDISVQAPVNASLSTAETATLNLVAQRNIDFTAAGSLSGVTGNLNVNLNAGTDVGFASVPGTNASSISMAPGSSISTGFGGNFTATAKGNGITLAGLSVGGNLSVNSNGGAISQNSALTVTGTSTFSAGSNSITLTSATNALSSQVSLNNSGNNNVSLTNNVATVFGTSLVGTGTLSVTSNGSITQTGPLTQAPGAGAVTFSAGANPITLTNAANDFTGVVNLPNTVGNNPVTITDANALAFGTLSIGAGSLSANSSGALNLGTGTVGGNLTANSGGGAITQSGALTINGTTILTAGAAPITLTNAANDFQGVVTLSNSGANAVQITDTNAISFTGMTLGGNFSVAAGGAISAGNTTNTGSQTWNGNVSFSGTKTTNGGAFLVTGATTLTGAATVSSGAGDATFAGTVDGANSLTVNSTGATTFGASVGGGTPLTSLTTDAGGITAINGGSVTTTGAQSYGDAVILGAATTITGANHSFAGTVNGAQSLTINDSGATVFSGAVGNLVPLASLTTNAGGSTAIFGGSIITTGAQTYGDPISLGANTTLTGSTPTFSNTVSGSGSNLTLAFSGSTTISGTQFTGINNLTSNNGGTTNLSGPITTSGTQTYSDAVSLIAATALGSTGNQAITFGNTVDGGQALQVNTTGATTFSGAVGGSIPLTSLTTNAGGSANLRDVKTTGAQTYNDTLITNGNYVTANSAFTAGGTMLLNGPTSISTAGGNVSIVGTVNGPNTLAINAGAGSVVFGTTVGATTPLTGFSITSPSIFAHDVTTVGNQLYQGNVTFNSTETTNGGNFTVNGSMTLGSNVTISAGAGSVIFSGTVVGTTAGGQFLVVNSTGATTFGSTVGSALIPIASLTTDAGGSTSFSGNVFTGGAALLVTTPTLVLGDTAGGTGTLLSNGGLISVSDISSVLGLATTGSIVFSGTGNVGSAGSPIAFTVTPANLQLLNPITLFFSSPAQPSSLIFAPGASVFAFLGGSGSFITLTSNASLSLAVSTVSTTPPADTAVTIGTAPPPATAAPPIADPGTGANSVASIPSDAGSTRPSSSSGLSREAIRQIDQQISQDRTQLFSSALAELTKDPTLADVAECGDGGGSDCVKQGKPKKAGLLAGDSEPVIKRRVALLFGNDRYLAPIPALDTPIHDVEDIGKVMQDRLGYETRVVRNATREQIVSELNRLVTEVDEDDSVFVYYAGHGYQGDKSSSGYWIPVDASNNEASTWISNGAISKFLANMASRQVMLVSDSCYSGTLTQEQKVRATESTVFDRSEILRKRSVLVMSSGGNEPVADGGHDNHSLFAYHLLRSLNDIKGELVGADVHESVRAAVMRDYPQDPQYGAVVSAGHSAGGEYLIERKR